MWTELKGICLPFKSSLEICIKFLMKIASNSLLPTQILIINHRRILIRFKLKFSSDIIFKSINGNCKKNSSLNILRVQNGCFEDSLWDIVWGIHHKRALAQRSWTLWKDPSIYWHLYTDNINCNAVKVSDAQLLSAFYIQQIEK